MTTTKHSKNGARSSPFISKRGTTRVVLTPEEHPVLSQEEWIEIRNGVTTKMMFQRGNGIDDPVPEFLLQAITDWSFDEEVTLENIEDMDAGITMMVWAEVQKNYPLSLQVRLQETTESSPTP